MTNIDTNMTVKEIVERWPQTLEVFVANGFEQFADAGTLQRVGRFLKLGSALQSKGFAVDTYLCLLEEKIAEAQENIDITLAEDANGDDYDIDVAGLLPCPVRVPLLEAFDAFCTDYQQRSGLKTRSRFEAASVGSDWIAANISTIASAAELPDIFISAGFDTFFDSKGIGQYRQQGVFSSVDMGGVNSDFSALALEDPQHSYTIISVVPAVFMVDKMELGDLPVPRSWRDILRPEYARRVALPVGDFDLFNAILLNIYEMFGTDGVERLGRSMLSSLHPAQMVKGAGRTQVDKPLVTILPYFFTRMAGNIASVEIVWPEDGAIISPIFLLAKKERLAQIGAVAEFLAGKQVGEILAQKGLFPSLNPQVENVLPPRAPWQWLGWDYIYNHDISEQIEHLERIFTVACEDG